MKDEDKELWKSASINSVASGVGAILGLAIAGPAGAIAGGFTGNASGPLIDASIRQISSSYSRRKEERMLKVFEVASNESELNPEELTERIIQDVKLEFIAVQGIIAGGNTYLDDKVIALGRALADGVASRDDAKVDEVALIISAISEMEMPHIKLLDYMSNAVRADLPEDIRYHSYRYRKASIKSLNSDMPEFGSTLPSVVSTLVRHGIIREIPVNLEKIFESFGKWTRLEKATNRLPREIRDAEQTWQVTPLGLETKNYLIGSANSMENVD